MKPPAEIWAYPRDATAMARGARRKFHAVGSQTDREKREEIGVAACSGELLFMESGMPMTDLPEQSLCQKAACQNVFCGQTRGRKTGKPDRRDGVPGSDRRAQRRRRGDETSLRSARRAYAREKTQWIGLLRMWPTTALIVEIAKEVRHRTTEPWKIEAVAYELDARVPPREKP